LASINPSIVGILELYYESENPIWGLGSAIWSVGAMCEPTKIDLELLADTTGEKDARENVT
jgi:hypothetical protein